MKMRKKTLGLILILFPWVLVPLVLSAYAIVSFVLASGIESNMGVIVRVVSSGLGLLGVVGIFGFIIGTPIGIYFLSRKEPDRLALLKSHPRFQSLTESELHLVSKWSWSAFFNPTIWALGNKLWLWALGTLIPFWQVYVWLRLSMDGRQIVWERNQWTMSQFLRRQKILAWVIGIFTMLAIGYGIASSSVPAVDPTKIPVLVPESTSVSEVVEDADVTASEKTVLSAKELFRPVEAPEESTEKTEQEFFILRGTPISCASAKDSDEDGIADEAEAILKTDPALADTDGDGYSDREELLAGYSPNDTFEYRDSDGDELADYWESAFYHSVITLADSDSDGLTDFEEVKAGSNPNGFGSLKSTLTDIGTDLLLVQTAREQCTFD